MTPDIIIKLNNLISEGINSEKDVVYLLAQTRKLLERDQLKQEFEWLNFHCNWVLHEQLRGDPVPKILEWFDHAHIIFTGDFKTRQLPFDLENEIQNISKMIYFREELSRYLTKKKITDFTQESSDWVKFLSIYTEVIENIPLTIYPSNDTLSIDSIVVNICFSHQDTKCFNVTWTVNDKNGLSGDWSVYNEYE